MSQYRAKENIPLARQTLPQAQDRSDEIARTFKITQDSGRDHSSFKAGDKTNCQDPKLSDEALAKEEHPLAPASIPGNKSLGYGQSVPTGLPSLPLVTGCDTGSNGTSLAHLRTAQPRG